MRTDRDFFVKISETPALVESPSPHPRITTYQSDINSTTFWQMIRFGMVGTLNTLIDVITLNILLLLFPTHNANLLLVYNTLAFTFGAMNSFFLNKHWTFKLKRTVNSGEVLRFAIMTFMSIACNDIIVWLTAKLLHPLISNTIVWANVSKLSAIIVTFLISYFGMRLWVFTIAPKRASENNPAD
jgi:putative flippase GtrA